MRRSVFFKCQTCLPLGCKRSGLMAIPGTKKLAKLPQNSGQCIQDSPFLHYMQ